MQEDAATQEATAPQESLDVDANQTLAVRVLGSGTAISSAAAFALNLSALNLST